MQIGPGMRIAHLTVVSKLGEGGMGEVWRATDSRLGREVAVKLLPSSVMSDPERMARFEREARLLAALNHPAIASIYGLEAAGETKLLIMELAEGETLEARLARGAIPTDEAIELAKQIASAMEAAHEKGIVHRDLKPGNIVVDAEGGVKVLDFGLARAISPEDAEPSGEVTTSPTVMKTGTTRDGLILGTAAYMSPEQARGRRVDERADIWAFGVVLWEMLTGKRLFAGETVSDTIASVLKDDPDWSALPDETPAAVRRLLRRALRKSPRERLRAIADARLELEDAEHVEQRGASRRRMLWPAAAAALLALLAIAGFVAATREDSATARELIAFTIDSPTGRGFDSIPALSPDGKLLAFIASEESDARIWIRRLDALDARPLAGTEGARMPFWSPDGRSIAFAAGNELKRVDLDGGTRVLCRTGGEFRGGTWSTRGVILFADVPSGLHLVSAMGGEPKRVAGIPNKHSLVFFPHFLPDGNSFIVKMGYSGDDVSFRGGLWAGDIRSDERKLLIEGTDISHVGRAEFDPDGWLLYEREDTVVAQRFDPERLELSGEPVRVLGRIHSAGPRESRFSVAAGGVLVWRDEGTYQPRQLTWFDRSGERLGTIGPPDRWGNFSIAPDGRTVAADRDEESIVSIFLLDAERGTVSRLTSEEYSFNPVWSADGTKLAIAATGGSPPNPFVLHLDGTRTPERVARFAGLLVPTGWSPDGKWMTAAGRSGEHERGDIVRISVADGAIEPLIATPFEERESAISPDGRWIAYRSDESGERAIYVTSFPEPGRRWQVSVGEGNNPRWRGDGRELFYSRSAGAEFEIVTVPVDTGSAFAAGQPRVLFTSPSLRYDVTADGERFLALVPAGAPNSPELKVVTDWKRFAGLNSNRDQ